jgi:hypothetical protein
VLEEVDELAFLFGSRLALICIVLAGFLTSMCTTLASSSALKMPNISGIPELSGAVGNRRLSSLSSVTVTTIVASLMLEGPDKATREGAR